VSVVDPAQPTPKKSGGLGPTIAIIVVIILCIGGACNKSSSSTPPSTPTVTDSCNRQDAADALKTLGFHVGGYDKDGLITQERWDRAIDGYCAALKNK
jgi:hypothetical protein